jgi:hypothetical protein
MDESAGPCLISAYGLASVLNVSIAPWRVGGLSEHVSEQTGINEERSATSETRANPRGLAPTDSPAALKKHLALCSEEKSLGFPMTPCLFSDAHELRSRFLGRKNATEHLPKAARERIVAKGASLFAPDGESLTSCEFLFPCH